MRMIKTPARDANAGKPKHFLNEDFGKTFQVPQYEKPVPSLPETQSSINMHQNRKRTFELRNRYHPEQVEGQDYDPN